MDIWVTNANLEEKNLKRFNFEKYFRFRNRWKDELTFKIGQNLSQNRAAACNEKNVDDFYKILSNKINELGN